MCQRDKELGFDLSPHVFGRDSQLHDPPQTARRRSAGQAAANGCATYFALDHAWSGTASASAFAERHLERETLAVTEDDDLDRVARFVRVERIRILIQVLHRLA